MYCLCVNVLCYRVSIQLQLTSISNIKCFRLKHVNSCMIDTLVSMCLEDNLYVLWSFYSLVQLPFSIDVVSSTNTALYSRNVFKEETDE